MNEQKSRREFLRNSALAGFGIWVSDPAKAQGGKSPNSRVQFGCIGVGGKGDSDSADAGRLGDVAAICDVDDDTLNHISLRFPKARKFNDYRKMLEVMGKSIDAVTVSIPDHSHGPAAILAMEMGKNCFCQKPLAHSILEVRIMADIARRKRLATQMGNQGTASSNLRKFAAMVKAGAIGTIQEIHVWTNRPIWPQGDIHPIPGPVPANLHWNLWQGPVKHRPYAPGYAPFSWRGFWDYGTGSLGDMACHTMNLPFMALDLRNPVAVEATSSPDNHFSYPASSVIKYYFGANEHRPAVVMTWHDGGHNPPLDLLPPGQTKFSDSGSLMIGDKGSVYSPGDYGDTNFLTGGVDVGEVTYPVSPGHFEEFVRAIQEGIPAMSNFPNYAGPLAEMVLTGNLGLWSTDKKIELDLPRMRVKNAPEVEPILKPRYYNGYRM